jgi:hypothetical protein
MAILPWDCVVLGIPKSVQAKAASIARWKAEVRAAAVAAWPDGDPVRCQNCVVTSDLQYLDYVTS